MKVVVVKSLFQKPVAFHADKAGFNPQRAINVGGTKFTVNLLHNMYVLVTEDGVSFTVEQDKLINLISKEKRKINGLTYNREDILKYLNQKDVVKAIRKFSEDYSDKVTQSGAVMATGKFKGVKFELISDENFTIVFGVKGNRVAMPVTDTTLDSQYGMNEFVIDLNSGVSVKYSDIKSIIDSVIDGTNEDTYNIVRCGV